MRTVDKNGVHIDQCESCKGIFLDRGELEQIASAESAYYGQQPPPYEPDVPPPASQWGQGSDSGHAYQPSPSFGYKDSPRPFRGGYADSPRPYGRGRKRKRSFLEDLFD